MKYFIKFGIFVLNIFYAILKLMPVQNKIVYISREMNTTPLDFSLIVDKIKEKDPSIKQVILARRIEKNLMGYIKYVFHIFRQMYHIATAKVVVLDTYCIPISILKQRNDLVVIQLWHALGAFKKFGYSIIDQEEGTSSQIADIMKMHYNYSYVFTSSAFCVPFFSEAFNVSKDKIKVFPIPKLDFLLDESKYMQTSQKIKQTYPMLMDSKKKNIVYAPTFRKDEKKLFLAVQNLVEVIDYEKYNLIIKLHPLTQIIIENNKVIQDFEYSTIEMFSVADYVITDYSASLFEATIINLPIVFYAFDLKEYTRNRSFYIDYLKDMPGPIQYTADDVYRTIKEDKFDFCEIEQFSRKMVASPKETYTEDIVDFILSNYIF